MTADVRVLFHVERVWIQVTSDHTLAREDLRHGFTKYICDNAQEDVGDIDRLRLEVENFLENRCEDRQPESPCTLVSSIKTSRIM